MSKTKWSDNLMLSSDFFKNDIVKYITSKENGNEMILFVLKLELDANERVGSNTYFHKTIFKKLEDMEVIHFETKEIIEKTIKLLEELEIFKFVDKGYTIKRFWMGNGERNRSSKEYTEWRTSVFERDNYTCRYCGERGNKLNAHHILRWADCKGERFNISNGITFCVECHKKIHRGERNEQF